MAERPVVRGCHTDGIVAVDECPPPIRLRRGLFGRPLLTVTIVLAALLGVGLGGVALANRDDSDSAAAVASPRRRPPVRPSAGAGRGRADRPTEPADADAITLSATGDIIMGNAPGRLPANGGKGFFDAVKRRRSPPTW